MAAAGFHSSGSQSPTSVTRTIEKVFDESQYTGEINLSGRKLKEYPKCSCKYDLIDITSADLSRNRFSEIPADICNCHSIERLCCYHNIIKCLPAAIVQLQNLVFLNLSRNQLSVIPPFIYRLEQLEVLLANNNKLVSLPEEIGRLQRLMQLDVSCNEITQLPDKIGDAESLQNLDVRKNLLVELPISICRLRLRRLNFSCNRIAHIPCDVRKVVTLEELSLDNNPLLSPPASICTRGIVHIMKFLNAQAARNETKKDVLYRSDFNVRGIVKRSQSCLPTSATDEAQLPTELSSIRSREPNSSLSLISSGYSSMADANEKSRWSHGECDSEILELECEPRAPMTRPLPVYFPDDNRIRAVWNTASPDDSSRNSTLRPADSMKVLREDQQQQQQQHKSSDSDNTANKTPPDNLFPKMTVRSPRSPGLSTAGGSTMDEITKELQRQRADYDAKRKRAEQLRLTVEETQREERRLAALRLQEQQQQQQQLSRINAENAKTTTSLQSDFPHSRSLSDAQKTSLYSAYRRTNSDTSTAVSSSCRTNGLNSTSPPSSGYGSSATTDRLQSAVDSGSSNGYAMPLRHTQTLPRRCGMPSWDNNSTGLPLEEEFRRRHEAVIAQRRREAHNVLSRLEEMQRTRPTNGENNGNGQATGKIEEEESSCSSDGTPNNSFIETGNTNANSASMPASPTKSADFTTPTKCTLPPNCQKALEAMSSELNGANPVFTIRRNLQQQTDERLQVDELRKIVETVLKIKLPEDMKNALHDGVVLCHLVNHLRPHTVSSIHVPSSAVPKLTLAKCRRNVENFLLACRRIGLNQSQICPASAILEDRDHGLFDIATTVRALVECAALPKQSAV